MPDLTLPCLGFSVFSNIIVFESKSFFHAIGNKQKLVRELLGIQIILFKSKQGEEGERITNRVKAMSAIKGAPHP